MMHWPRSLRARGGRDQCVCNTPPMQYRSLAVYRARDLLYAALDAPHPRYPLSGPLGWLVILPLLLLSGGELLAQRPTLIRNVIVVDIEAGKTGELTSILIRGDSIAAVGSELQRPVNARTLDADGAYAIPGLWDSHVHVFSTPDEPSFALPLYLLHGVTGIRDMGALWSIDAQLALRDSIEAGDVLGPRIIVSGAWVDAPPGSWPGMFLADSPAAAKSVVDTIAEQGWAAVKAYSMLDRETYLALAQAAGHHGLRLVGHVPESVELSTAIAAGQTGVEHFGRVTKACATQEAEMVAELRRALLDGEEQARVFERMAGHNRTTLESWDEEVCDATLEQMARNGVHVSPTLVVADFYTGNWPSPDAPRMQTVPAGVRAAWGEPDFRLEAMTDEVRALADSSIALDRATFRRAHRAGVPILAATDASFANPYLFHGSSHIDELDLYVEAGLTPREAIYSATVAPAEFFALPDQDGTLRPGRRADIVLVADNPLESLSALRSPVAVIAGGRVLDRSRLHQMESELRDAANRR